MAVVVKVGIPDDIKNEIVSLRSWCGNEYGMSTLCNRLTEIYYDMFYQRLVSVLDAVLLGLKPHYLAMLDSEEETALDALEDLKDCDISEVIDAMPQNHPLFASLVSAPIENARSIILINMVESLPSVFEFKKILAPLIKELSTLLETYEYDNLNHVSVNYSLFIVRLL